MTFNDFKTKIQGKTLYQLANCISNRLIHIEHISYNIMFIDLSHTEFIDNTKIIIVPMTAEDAENLPTDYFCEFDHHYKKNALLRKDPLFEGYMCYDQAHNFVGYCWIMFRKSEYEFFKIFHTDAYVAEFYVSPSMRGHRFGSEMLTGIGQILKSKGIKQIKLAVRKHNRSAIKCYERAHFVCIDQHSIFRNTKKRKVYPHYEL